MSKKGEEGGILETLLDVLFIACVVLALVCFGRSIVKTEVLASSGVSVTQIQKKGD